VRVLMLPAASPIWRNWSWLPVTQYS
jgi:hypothetical protein